MATLADKYRAYLLSLVGEDYQWGEEVEPHRVGPAATKDPRDTDCSGLFYSGLREVGVQIARVTAHGYYRMGKRIDKPSMVGADFFVLLDSAGHAHHIGCYIGKTDTVEARGEAYGVVRYTVAQVNARGGVWLRMPGVNLGALTADQPVAKPALPWPGVYFHKGMHGKAVRRIQRELIKRGFSCGRWGDDGDFGRATVRAVKRFQRKHGLKDDGIVGSITWRRLFR